MIYNLVLSNGSKLGVDAASASEAIGSALIENPGHTVVTCSTGDKNGFIKFEIPPHQAIKKQVVDKKKPTSEAGLFDDAEIKRESRLAKDKASY